MKKYYFIDLEGNKKLARKTENVYNYALVYRYDILKLDEIVYCCSSKKETLEKKVIYLTKGYYAIQNGDNTNKYWSDQFHEPSRLRIVFLHE